MVKDAVSLYEHATNGMNKPSLQDCTLLLRNIVVAKVVDMELFFRVVKKFTENGNALDEFMLDSVLKSLTSVGKMKMYSKVLDALVGQFKRVGGDLEKTKDYFEKMVHKEGSSSSCTVYALDFLANAYCNRERAAEAYKILSVLMSKQYIRPGHDTYKTLISKLLTQNCFKEA